MAELELRCTQFDTAASVCKPSKTDGSSLLLPQVILEMPVTEIIVSHLRVQSSTVIVIQYPGDLRVIPNIGRPSELLTQDGMPSSSSSPYFGQDLGRGSCVGWIVLESALTLRSV
jgi:hypothetical protein